MTVVKVSSRTVISSIVRISFVQASRPPYIGFQVPIFQVLISRIKILRVPCPISQTFKIRIILTILARILDIPTKGRHLQTPVYRLHLRLSRLPQVQANQVRPQPRDFKSRIVHKDSLSVFTIRMLITTKTPITRIVGNTNEPILPPAKRMSL